ncbi:MAG: Calx-beta domain-containing protein, partial [Gammaproteobacteria bacterium]
AAESATAMPADLAPATSVDADPAAVSPSSQTADIPAAPSVTQQPEPVAPPPQGPGRLQLDAANYRVDESSAVLIARVIRTGGSGGSVAFRWRTLPGSASADQDYIGTEWQRVELADGQSVTRLFVPLVNDGRTEPDESFILEIADAEGGAELGSRTRAEVSIIDDDAG